MKDRLARLLFPALRWNNEGQFVAENYTMEDALRAGVGGFIIFGGPADAVSQLTSVTQSRCDHALLFGSDLERGAGQQFAGCTQMPPLAAIGELDELSVTRRTGSITAREARALGVNWAFAPVADTDTEPCNPIVGTRAFGDAPAQVSRHVSAWVQGCHDGDALACAKHFPGHGRTTEDSHAMLPRVRASRHDLDEDIEPFRAAIAAGVDGIMTAHIVYDALDAEQPATLSKPIITELLRKELRFDGMVVTDGLGMQGILDACGGDEARAAIAAVNAGCDVLLYPHDAARTIEAMRGELRRTLDGKRVEQAAERIARAADRTAGSVATVDADNAAWSLEVALRSIQSPRSSISLARRFDVLTIDDDVGGPFAPPPRASFIATLADRGLDPQEVMRANAEHPLVIAVYSDIRAWKGAPGLSNMASARLAQALQTRADAVIVLFGHPRLAEQIDASNLVVAWGGEDIMQRAAAMWLARANGQS